MWLWFWLWLWLWVGLAVGEVGGRVCVQVVETNKKERQRASFMLKRIGPRDPRRNKSQVPSAAKPPSRSQKRNAFDVQTIVFFSPSHFLTQSFFGKEETDKRNWRNKKKKHHPFTTQHHTIPTHATTAVLADSTCSSSPYSTAVPLLLFAKSAKNRPPRPSPILYFFHA